MKKIRFMLVALAIMAVSLTCMTSCMFIPGNFEIDDIFGSLFGSHSEYEDCRAGHHNWYMEGYEEPHCHYEGYKYYRCSRCGEYKAERLDQLDHEIVDDEGYEPTCSNEGYTGGKYCERCGETIESGKMIPRIDHQNTHISGAKESTCSEAGYTGDTVCSDCGEIILSGKEINPKPHSYVTDKGYDATCTEEGLTDGSHCEVCGYVNNVQTVIPKYHIEEYIYGIEPTCTESGWTYGYRCALCKIYLTEPEEIPANGHDEIIISVGYPATCNSDGRADKVWCDVCQEYISNGEVIPAGHTEEIIPAIEPTCSSYGYTEGKVCTACGVVTVAQEKLAKTAHANIVDVEGYAATCRYNGLTSGKVCADCGAPTVTQHTIAAVGHVFTSDGHCSGCDLVITDCLDYTEHNGSYILNGFMDACGDNVSVLVIPESYNGKPVAMIDDGAFANCSQLTKVMIPNTVIYIGENAFDGCSSLSSVEFDTLEQYKIISEHGVDWLGDSDSAKIQVFNANRGMTPYEVYLYAMNSVNHNLNRYELVSDGITYMTYMGTTAPMLATRMVQRQYYNDFYIYQSSTDLMSSSSAVDELYYVNNYLYCTTMGMSFYCSPEAFGDIFLVENGDIPQLTEKFFKDASFEVADGKMYLVIEMDEELIEALIKEVAGISADMTITSCIYSYEFDMDGNILSYTSDMVYSITGQPYAFEAISVTYFNEIGTLPPIEAPYGCTDYSAVLQNQCTGGHTVVERDEVPATCFGQGKTAYSYCERCYVAIESYDVISPSHSYHNGECAECGNFESDDVSVGLAYVLNDEGTGYILVGMGDCKDETVVVPQMIYGLPVITVNADFFEANVSGICIGNQTWSAEQFSGCEDATQYWSWE